MTTPDTIPLTEETLHAWVDGQLPEAQRADLQARLAQDPKATATVAAWQHQREQLRALHASVLHEPLPAALVAASQGAARRRQQVALWQRWGGLAASVVLVFGLGWSSHGWWTSAQQGGALTAQEFARQAGVAHAVYVAEQRHPVEVAAAQQDHLVQWLSKRLDRPLRVPDLQAQGFALVGGRLLPGDAGARAQLMFEHGNGQRVTLYLGALPAVGQAETAFRYQADGPAPGFYWIDHGFGYALTGPLSRQELLALAEAVYRQLP